MFQNTSMFDEGICESNYGSICPAKCTVSDRKLQQGRVLTAHPSTPKARHEDAGPYSGNHLVHIFTSIQKRHAYIDESVSPQGQSLCKILGER